MMTTSTIVDLAGERDWDPVRVTAAAFRWPTERFETVRIADVTMPVETDAWASEGTSVITPASIDAVHGGIRRRSRKHQGAVYSVTSSGPGLHPLDLLVPPLPDLPVLLLHEGLIGSTVSGRFIALRPTDGNAVWLWAVLSSRSGRELRRHAVAGAQHGADSAVTRLIEREIPWPTYEEAARIEGPLLRVEAGTHRQEEEAIETWWRVTDLADHNWQRVLATPTPDRLGAGIPLGDLCTAILKGHLDQRHVEPVALPGLLPIADVGVLSGKPTRRWAPPEAGRPTIAEEGDVLVAAVGERPHATVATRPFLLHNNVYGLRLRETALSNAVVRYLNGQEGFGLRQALLTGSTVPHLSRADLRRFPVPLAALKSDIPAEPSVSLSAQLEQLLWS